MAKRGDLVSSRNGPVTLVGDPPETGQPAPAFVALRNDSSPASLADFGGKVCIISSVPSLDTPVCDAQTRRFNQEAVALGPSTVVLTISMDLPFAQQRWCAAAGVDRVVTLSDHKDASFGRAYGLLMKESRLLARAVFVVDAEGIIRYRQIVPKLSEEPDYQPVLDATAKLVHSN